MKPNEASEKIYLEWYCIGNEKYREWVITPKTNNEPIQYTRTDAFIEKAENYLRNKCQRFILTEKDIEDFVNYMKGE